MVKVEHDGIVYYIRDALVVKAVTEFQRLNENGYHFASRPLMQFAEFAVDKRTNELKKCRYELEAVVDAAVKTLYN